VKSYELDTASAISRSVIAFIEDLGGHKIEPIEQKPN